MYWVVNGSRLLVILIVVYYINYDTTCVMKAIGMGILEDIHR